MFAPSPLSLAAIAFYLLVVLATASALAVARGQRQKPWHMRSWLALALLFVLLAADRWLGIEEFVRDYLRETLRADAAYRARQDFQRPLASAVVAIAGTACFLWVFRTTRNVRGRRNLAIMVGLAGGLGMLILIALRLISLHVVDQLLYGALKLNWVADIGLSLVVAGAAVQYIRIVRA